ncbi:MAG: efflux transporter outer membrane subunit [Planctomycetota bacterium]|nr:MAG: efflux transporter outer membrane subunit [Planctomycetota bacterium]
MNLRRAATRPGSLAATAALLLSFSCTTVGPDYAPPAAAVAAGWREQADPALAPEPPDLNAWWLYLEDPVLNGLIERALRQGLDLREALARVHEARALRGVAAADRFPTLDAVLSYERRGESENTTLGQFLPDSGLYTAGFDAAWEIDLWGRVRRSVEAADADLEAGIEDTRDVAVTVAAETARNYIELRGFQKRLAIARSNVGLQEQTLALVAARYESGLVGERDVAQAASNLESTRARVPALEVGLRAAENRLAVLLALAPGALAAELAETRPIPVPPLELAVGVPADLLRRRADVRRAERVLAAETARVGVAEGDLYPRLSLIGSLGLQSEDLSDLAHSGSEFFHFGPSLRWNLFDRERLHGRVEAQDARREQALLRWERAVLTALEEAENAMTAFLREQLRRRSLRAASDQARLAVDLSQSQYTEGITDFQAVLDSERALAQLEDDLAQSDAAIATSAVALYKALGGGWEHMHGSGYARSMESAR